MTNKEEVFEWIDNCLVLDYKLGRNRDVNISMLKRLINDLTKGDGYRNIII
jgi:hypothetical protein